MAKTDAAVEKGQVRLCPYCQIPLTPRDFSQKPEKDRASVGTPRQRRASWGSGDGAVIKSRLQCPECKYPDSKASGVEEVPHV